MANITDCSNRCVKISEHSITIKSVDGKTAGVVRNIVSLRDIQPNKQMSYFKRIKDAVGGLHNKIRMQDCIIYDGDIYVFRNIKSKQFNAQHGYFSEAEKTNEKQMDAVYEQISASGIPIIECVYV